MTDFKVGDRVRLTGSDWGRGESPKKGGVYEVVEVNNTASMFLDTEGTQWWIYPHQWEAELVTEISTEPKIGATFSLMVTRGVEYQEVTGLSGEELGRRIAQLTEWFPYAEFDIETEVGE